MEALFLQHQLLQRDLETFCEYRYLYLYFILKRISASGFKQSIVNKYYNVKAKNESEAKENI